MAHIDTGGGKGRGVSVELNLVPFIDLMSVLICFLLITAVWTQISMMQIGSSVYGKRSEDVEPKLTPNVDVVLKLDVMESGYRLTMGQQSYTLALVEGEYDGEGLMEQLRGFKERYPEKVDAVVTVADALPYRALIESMDHLLMAGFPQIAVATGGPGNAN